MDAYTAKNRPRQSCINCRERKVKCDRATPCTACCARGLGTECRYLASDEDRESINQAGVIEELRREVNRLRELADDDDDDDDDDDEDDYDDNDDYGVNEYNEHEENFQQPLHGYVDPHGSTHMTNQTIAYEATGPYQHQDLLSQFSQQQFQQYPSEQYEEYHFQFQPQSQYGYDMQYATPISTSDTSYSDPPAPGASPAWTHSSWSSRSETTPIHVPMQMQQIQMQSTHMAMHIQHIQQTMLQQTLANDSWKGKEALLEALLNTIVDCDDRWLGLVIEIVRTSPSPEAAMAAIQSIPLSMNTEHTV